MSQIRRLKEDSELLHEAQIASDGIDHPDNNIYKLKEIDGDTITLYQSGYHAGRPYYSSRGYLLQDLLNGQWLARNS
jgi:hypothetical protein